MLRARPAQRHLIALSLATLFASHPAFAATITKADNTEALNLPSSWIGGIVPGPADIAQWNSTLAVPSITMLGANLAWDGILLSDPSVPVTLGADSNTLTLGASGITMTASSNALSINSYLALATAQTWTNLSPATLSINSTTTSSSLLTLAGNTFLGAANTLTAGLTINSGIITLGNESALGGNTAGPLTFGPNSNALLRLSGTSTSSNDIPIGTLSGDNTATLQNALTTSAVNTLVINSNTSTTFSGAINDGSPGRVGLRLLAGTLTLDGSVNTTGPLLVASGKLILAGTQVNMSTAGLLPGGSDAGSAAIGQTGNATLQVDGAHLTSFIGASDQPPSLRVGSGASSTGALVLNSGSVYTSSELWIGTVGGSFGALIVNGGSLATNSWLALARGTGVGFATGTGVMLVNGGTISVNSNPLTVGSIDGVSDPGVLHASLTATGGTINANQNLFVAELCSAVVTISQNAMLNVSEQSPNAGYGAIHGIRITNTPGITGILNLDGGTVTTTQVAKGGLAGSSATAIMNFNGGVLRASGPASVSGLDKLYVYPGGAIVDDNGFSIKLPTMLAPTGNGIDSISIATASGFIAPPLVAISGGGGTGATAVASIDANGNLTGITITNPGVGYTATPTVTLTGGGGILTNSTPTIMLIPNTSGGLTKLGSGTLFLSGANTFTGPTVVTSGVLCIASNATLAQVTIQGGTALTGTVTNATTLTAPVTILGGSTPATQGILGSFDNTFKTFIIGGDVTAGGQTGEPSVFRFTIGDQIELGKKSLILNPGGTIISLRPNPSVAITLGHAYRLLTYTDSAPPDNVTFDPFSTHCSINTIFNVTSTAITVTFNGPAFPATAYWTGAFGNAWNAVGGAGDLANFNTNSSSGINTNQYPSIITNVHFAAINPTPSNFSTTLGQNFYIRNLFVDAGSPPVTIAGPGVLSMTGEGILQVDSASSGLTLSAPVYFVAPQSWNNSGASSVVLSGPATGSLDLSANGGFLLTGDWSAAPGLITIASGTFQIGDGGTAGVLNPSISITNNSSLIINHSDLITLAGQYKGSGSLTLTGTGTLALTGTNSFSGPISIASGALLVGSSSGSGPITNNSHLILLSNALPSPLEALLSTNVAIPNDISGPGAVDLLVGFDGAYPGQFLLSGNQTYSGPTTLLMAGTSPSVATLIFSGSASHSIGPVIRSVGTLTLRIDPDATLTSDGFTLDSLIVNGTQIIRPSDAGAGTSKTTSILIANNTTSGFTAKLDLTTNKLILQSTNPTDKAMKLQQLTAALHSGSNNNTWTGKGITSTTASQDPQHYAVALFDNALLGLSSFGNQPVDPNSLLITIAHLGDANDNGTVDIQDLTIIANNWQKSATNWAQGDLNLDGVVDIQDLTIIANNWQQTSSFSIQNSSFSISNVPEPASVLLLLPLFTLTHRRPKKS